jgi:predicted membrane channel-forming protein YqfA (hemolysin III family)
MAVALVSDVAIATTNSESPPPWQTWSDPCIAALLLLLFFSYRRAVLDPSETLGTFGDCRLGMLRMQHADGKCGPARSTGYLVLALSFVLIAPCYVNTLSATEATVSITCSLAGFLFLVLGLLIDNVMAWPDVYIMRELGAALDDILTSTKFTFTVRATKSTCEQARARSSLADACSSRYFGCIMTSHALWHICTVFSVGVVCFGREFALVSAGL